MVMSNWPRPPRLRISSTVRAPAMPFPITTSFCFNDMLLLTNSERRREEERRRWRSRAFAPWHFGRVDKRGNFAAKISAKSGRIERDTAIDKRKENSERNHHKTDSLIWRSTPKSSVQSDSSINHDFLMSTV